MRARRACRAGYVMPSTESTLGWGSDGGSQRARALGSSARAVALTGGDVAGAFAFGADQQLRDHRGGDHRR